MKDVLNREEIAQRLKKAGFRLTKQRLAVLEALEGTKDHPDANWIYEEVRRDIPKISLGTIYRTLGILKSAGLIRELDYGPVMSHYDGNPKRHPHIVCIRCHRIEDLALTDHDLEQEAKASTDFVITDYRIEFYGLCPRCRTLGKGDDST